jgi:hypothetical protein
LRICHIGRYLGERLRPLPKRRMRALLQPSAETFRDEADRILWVARRAEVIGRMRTAVESMSLSDVEIADVNGWALGMRAPPVDLIVSVNKPLYDAMGIDHVVLVQKASRQDGFVPGRPVRREIRVDFVPGTHLPSVAGNASLADVVSWNAERLSTRNLPDHQPVIRRTPVRRRAGA